MEAQSPLAPVAIAVAPNGGRRTKADHPAIPLTAALKIILDHIDTMRAYGAWLGE